MTSSEEMAKKLVFDIDQYITYKTSAFGLNTEGTDSAALQHLRKEMLQHLTEMFEELRKK
jgi:hypothetical protein